MNSSNPHIDVRVTKDEKVRIQQCAIERRQSLSEFVRTTVLAACVPQGRLPSNAESQLVDLIEQTGEIRKLLGVVEARGAQIERLAGAAIASSAFAAFSKADGEAFQAGVRSHVKAALSGSAQVIKERDAGDAALRPVARVE
jgi:hypothetical protein